MLILVDELLSVGLEEETIKKVRLKGKYSWLEDALRFLKPGVLPKKITMQPLSVDREIEYFADLFMEHDKILYFYDSRYRTQNMLDRLHNWFLPDKILWTVPIHGNKAEYAYKLHNLQSFIQADTTFTDITRYLRHLDRKMKRWIISHSPTKVLNPNKHNAIYKEKVKQHFVLMEVLSGQKGKNYETGSLEQIIEKLISMNADQEIWAVTKGVDSELLKIDHQTQVKSETLPIGIPYVYVVTIK